MVASVTAFCHANVCVCHPISRRTYRCNFPTAAALTSRAASIISSISSCSSSSSESCAPNCCTLFSHTLSMMRLMTRFEGGFAPKYPARFASISASNNHSVTSCSVYRAFLTRNMLASAFVRCRALIPTMNSLQVSSIRVCHCESAFAFTFGATT